MVFELIDCTIDFDDLVIEVEQLKRVKRALDWLAQLETKKVESCVPLSTYVPDIETKKEGRGVPLPSAEAKCSP